MAMKLLKEAASGNAKFYVQFGGQGAPWFKELGKYYAEPEMKKFFDVAIEATEKAVKSVAGTVALPYPVELRKWLDNPETVPGDDQLAIAGVSMPMIEITQFAHVENMNLKGFTINDIIQNAAGTTGHSQGLIAASFAALDLKGDVYYQALGLYVQYLMLMGVRAQEVFTEVFATDAQNEKSEANGVKAPAPMVAVLGADHNAIEAMVAETNKALPDGEKVYVSLYNSPSNRILSSPRNSLIKFHEEHKAKLEELGVKDVYLRSSCPFHCELMKPIQEKFAKDVEALGFSYTGKDLKVPLYSFFDGRNMQNDAELGNTMCEELMVKTLYWDQSMKPVAGDSSITHVIDYGPGKTSQRLSLDTLAGLGVERTVLSAAVPKDQKTLFEEA